MPETILIGRASGDITPKGTICLYGQFYTRASRYVETPLTANCA